MKRIFKRSKAEQARISAVRQAAVRRRWGPMTEAQRKAAMLKVQQGRKDAAAKRRLRKATVGEDGRTSGNLIGE